MDVRIKNYAAKINLAVLQKDASTVTVLADSFIRDLRSYQFPDILNHYHVNSLITSIIMDIEYYTNDATKEYIENFLKTMLHYDCLDELEKKLTFLLKYLCTGNESPIQDIQEEESQLVKKIKTYVDNYYSDCNLNIASIADTIHLSPKYMSKLFRDDTNEGLLDYINQIRINHAKELLKTTSINIDELASMVGFSNSRSFRRNFIKATGITPTDYRSNTFS